VKKGRRPSRMSEGEWGSTERLSQRSDGKDDHRDGEKAGAEKEGMSGAAERGKRAPESFVFNTLSHEERREEEGGPSQPWGEKKGKKNGETASPRRKEGKRALHDGGEGGKSLSAAGKKEERDRDYDGMGGAKEDKWVGGGLLSGRKSVLEMKV